MRRRRKEAIRGADGDGSWWRGDVGVGRRDALNRVRNTDTAHPSLALQAAFPKYLSPPPSQAPGGA